jgi:diguanylate cyclase
VVTGVPAGDATPDRGGLFVPSQSAEGTAVVEHGPFPGFSGAASAALRLLSQQLPEMDLWLVTCVNADGQYVVASEGRWAGAAGPGSRFAWQSSFCVRMVDGRGPTLAVDVGAVPAYREAAVGPLAKVRAYLGVPLWLGEGSLFGTLCAFAGTAQPDTVSGHLPLVAMTARMLSSLITSEHAAHDRSVEAATAYAVANRDPVTGLHNQRGFAAVCESEDARCRIFGRHASVVQVGIEPPVDQEDLIRCAEVITACCAGCDTVSRMPGHRLAVLAVETDLVAARALGARLRQALHGAGFGVSIGVASRRAGERLVDTSRRADQALLRDRDPHTRRQRILRDAARRAR